MEVSSMFPCKGCTPWQGLLFTASILTCWHLSTTDHFGVEVVPPYVANGDSVLFLVRNLPKNLLSFAWIKGGTSMNDAIIVYIPNNNLSVPGRFHSGRETVYGNGSLLIQNVNQNDTGVYSLRAFNRRTDTVSQIGTYLYVNNILWTCGRLTPSPRPTVESVPPSVPHGGNVFLRVRNPPENMVGFIWYKWMNTFTRVEVGRYMVDKKTTQLGPAYTGRETWYSDGTLLLRSVTQEELYLIQIQRKFLETEEILVKVQVDGMPGTHRSQTEELDPLKIDLQTGYELPCLYWKQNKCPLQEQSVLLTTEPSLQHTQNRHLLKLSMAKIDFCKKTAVPASHKPEKASRVKTLDTCSYTDSLSVTHDA